MLASNAVRLAISKGLHRQPASTWNRPQHETRKRSKLFWILYTLDRQIASRSGRPPAIDDDDISCDAPETLLPADSSSDTFCTICIKLSQIQSRAYKRLSSARALRQSAEELIRAVAELHEEVILFKRTINHIIDLDEQLDEMPMPRMMTMFQLIMVYFLYYSVLFDIHTPLMLPWFHLTGSKRFDTFHPQVQNSCAIIARTARVAILGCRLVQLDANTPVL
ncbi:uncharacterized protein A1O9_09536 [Exophiala aquamarina CBS 119918]|uniref:Xylanolytic transcriptional activator regulatory domain-containing protein n=1 Tax=Exophiala aquamarina CBS 119918 TaxID=1182545 RepID=A0A072PFQ7_9EURO|nr:uncharacterized protein A1O9_09536 [Exophiala aquamarina CBS 119918]KEF54370.1 hypothetical protein A1O9_09536 [Exophiala aquamarina CBS 119918]